MNQGIHTIVHSLAAALLAAVCGCGSPPLRTPEADAVAKMPPLLQSVAVTVAFNPPQADLYGTPEEWEHDLRRLFREPLRVSEVVLEPDAGGALAEADIELAVTIRGRDPVEPAVDPRGATLDVLAWVSIPFLPLWIEDVRVDPGLQVEVDGNRRETDPVMTSLLDRHPFFSLPVAGALLVPPFVFKDRSPDHVSSGFAESVRAQVALELARSLKAPPSSGEPLVTEGFAYIEANGDLLIACRHSPNAKELRFFLERPDRGAEEAARIVINARDAEGATRTLLFIEDRERPLTVVPQGDGGDLIGFPLPRESWTGAVRVRIHATHSAGDQEVRYTVVIPAGESDREAS